MADNSTITREMIEVAAERIVQRLEDATPGLPFYCKADREEAVEIAREEITALATGGARDDVRCQCVSTFGPNPECGACGGSGCVSMGGARG